MKFADGFWLNQKGYDVNYASQAYEIKTGKNFINVLATTNYIQNRGMTLGGPVFDITYSCTQKNVIKVSINHYMGTLDNAPKFDLYEDQGFTPEIVDGDVIDFLCDYYGYDGSFLDSYMLGDRMIVDGELSISNVYIDASAANACYRFTDIYNQQYWTPVIP